MRELIDMLISTVHISAEAAAAHGNDLVSIGLAVYLKSFQGALHDIVKGGGERLYSHRCPAVGEEDAVGLSCKQ